MADELNIITPTPYHSGQKVTVKLAHQAAIAQLAGFLNWPECHHTRASGFTVHIAARRDGSRMNADERERAWVRFAIDGRRKDQFAVLSWLAQLAHDAETEDLVTLPPLPYVQVARDGEPLDAEPHRFTRSDGTLSGQRLFPDDSRN